MSSRYITRRWGLQDTTRGTSLSREERARSSERYSRARTSSPVREQGYTNQFTNTVQYYRPADNEVTSHYPLSLLTLQHSQYTRETFSSASSSPVRPTSTAPPT